jgi:hypothetical protein
MTSKRGIRTGAENEISVKAQRSANQHRVGQAAATTPGSSSSSGLSHSDIGKKPFFKLILLLPLKRGKKTVFQFPFGHVITWCMYTTSSIRRGIREKGGAR